MVAQFVNAGLSGKKPPEIEKIYPNLFEDEPEQKQKEVSKRSMMLKEQWIDFANIHNKNNQKRESVRT